MALTKLTFPFQAAWMNGDSGSTFIWGPLGQVPYAFDTYVNIFESHSQITFLLVSISERDCFSMAGTRQCKVLNVAEKNDAARELAKIMSRGRFQRVSTITECIMATGLLVGCSSCLIT